VQERCHDSEMANKIYGSVSGPPIEVIPPEPLTLPGPPDDEDGLEAYYAERVGTAWRGAVENIIAAGRWLAEAKERLPHGRFQVMVKERVGMSPETAQRLMAIANDPWIGNAAHARYLPPNWYSLYLITRLPVADREHLISVGCICPDVRRADLEEAMRQLDEARSGKPEATDPSPKSGRSSRASRSIFDRRTSDAPPSIVPSLPVISEAALAPDEEHAVLLDVLRFVLDNARLLNNGKAIAFVVKDGNARELARLLAQGRAILSRCGRN
jgi:hypothetical protein